MKTVIIQSLPGFDEWRKYARFLLSENIRPEDVIWKDVENSQSGLFEEGLAINDQKQSHNLKIPKSFLENARIACCYKKTERFDLLYRLIWRLVFENKNLLQLTTDKDVMAFRHMIKAVRRDAYKITAFLRFREIQYNGQEHFVAWYQPEHYSLEFKLGFFQTRFKNMNWSILTPYRAAHWDGQNIRLEDNPDPNLYPKEDQVEQYWLTYYASIFNPARTKKSAMLSQMPKKYWKNIPEAELIEDLLRSSESNTKKMIQNQ